LKELLAPGGADLFVNVEVFAMSSGTPSVKAADLRHDWHVVDATDQVLGRLATRVARLLSGKHRANWVAHLDGGDFVVVTNAEKIKLTGRKVEQKVYRHHTGYPGGLKSVGAREMLTASPERIIEEAVRGMLPKSKLGRRQLRKLKVYRGGRHPHEAQKPRALALAVSKA
jgi:large subunit ribosomal protein L13